MTLRSIALLALVGGAVMLSTTAMAQRDPAYQAARDAGQIGEKPDGYLGFVTAPTPALRAMVEDINIKRKAAYTERAVATGATIEEYAFTNGCNLIANTKLGEKYQGPDGTWRTRTAAAPTRDSRCL